MANQHQVAVWWTTAMLTGPKTHLEQQPAAQRKLERPLTGQHQEVTLETLTRKQKAGLAVRCRCRLAWNDEIGAYRRNGRV